MKKYKISEFSKLMGVSLKTLKHYEKFKILVPEVDEESNYRYYNFFHGGKMLRSRCFTNLGFTVKKTSQIMSNMGNDKIIDELEMQEEISSKELELAILRQKRLREIKRRYVLFNEKANSWIIKNRKKCYFLKHVHNNSFIENNNWNRIEELMKYQPHVLELSYFHTEDFNENNIKNSLGLGIYADTAERLGIDVSEPMVYIKEEKCFLYIYSDFYGENRPYTIVKKVLKIMKEEGFTLSGDILVESGLDQYPNSERVYQCLVWIPIKE